MGRLRIAVIATVMALSGPVFAQQPAASPPVDFSTVEIKTTDLGDNCYMLEGQGGNITVAGAKAGIIMSDSEFAPLHDNINTPNEAISKQPTTYVVNPTFLNDPTDGTVISHNDHDTRRVT